MNINTRPVVLIRPLAASIAAQRSRRRPPAPTPSDDVRALSIASFKRFLRLPRAVACIDLRGATCGWACALASVLTLLPACTPSRSGQQGGGPYAPQSEVLRDTTAAERLTHQAAPLVTTNPEKAEALLREALTADLYHGPAHNNLGVVYLKQNKLYEAAGEFEWAKKLLPGHPDPRMNLALVFERAGRTDEALTAYAAALEVYPDHLPTMQALSRLQLRSARTDDRTTHYLREIALRGDTDQWKDWARLRLAGRE